MDLQLQGALIAGISLITGVIITGIINGVITSISNKQQQKAALDRLKLEIETREKQERKKTIVSSRAYLSDLRRDVARISVEYRALNSFIGGLITAMMAMSSGPATPANVEGARMIKEQAEVVSKTAQNISEISQSLAYLNGQSSDKTLANLMDSYMRQITSKTDTIKKLLYWLNHPNAEKPTQEELEFLDKNENELTTQINKRIEDLMCGDC